ncbi:spore protein YabP [Oxobacter pfennigii]|uniref:Spore protein YabP n=1 Tax=Oxobacter pfennigii TaxID=36849 RepID=A0A0P8WKE6_9CLOT|nr:sporulation protein YabP [Oxobacter pfennigii]KPU42778.1 spore protein YabP [Oxobacter pfennigii]
MDERNRVKPELKPQSSRILKGDRKHSYSLENREKMVLSGVLNVESFNEGEIMLETELGMLSIKGSALHMSKLNLETGDLLINGSIDSCVYSEKQDFKTKGAGILSKLFK